MATMAELRARSASTGTERKDKLKRTLKIGSITVASVFAGLLLTIWISGAIHSNLEHASTSPARHYTQPRQEWGLAVAPASPCDSNEVPYLFEATKPVQPFNKAGQCGPVLWYKGHCVWALGYNSTTPVKLCDKPGLPQGDVPLNLEYIWSADGYAFQDKYRLDPPRTTAFVTIVR